MIQELDEVVLTTDIPEHGLKKGEEGIVVDIYQQGRGYAVEFFTPKGRTKAVTVVFASQIRPLASSFEGE